MIALDGKEDGLYFYRKITEKSREHLKQGGCLLFEIGYDQGEDVAKMMEKAGFTEGNGKKGSWRDLTVWYPACTIDERNGGIDMFDKLEDLLIRYEEIMGELQEPDVANDQERFRKLMKEQADLAPIVEAYTEYKKAKQSIADSEEMLEIESDEEMRELAKEELSSSKKRVEELEHELKILLLPKDPNDDKNIMVEIRAGAGGDESALFAAEVYRMYVHYAESKRWKTEMISVNENGSVDLRKSYSW